MCESYANNSFVPFLEEDMQHPVDVELKKIRSFLSRKPGYNDDIDIKVPNSNIILEPSYIIPLVSINDLASGISLIQSMTGKKQLSKSDIDKQIRERGQDYVLVGYVFSPKENSPENVNESLSRGSLYRRRYRRRY